MEIKIYQNYYLEEQKQYLDPAFIPYDNTENKSPELREYPILKKLHEVHKNDNLWWGLVSWRWAEKVKLSGKDYISFIERNSTYDVCHANYDHQGANKTKNVILQGEMHHKGMLKYFERLNSLMGWKLNFHDAYDKKYYMTCSFYVMHSKLWNDWIKFLDDCLFVTKNDQALNHYLYVETSHRNKQKIPNFSFVVERLITIFCIVNKLNVIEFTQFKNTPSVLRK